RGLAEITAHHARPLHEEEAFAIDERAFAGHLIDHLHAHSWNRRSDRSRLRAEPRTPVRVHVWTVDGHDRRHLGAPVSLQQVDPEGLAERGGEWLAQLFG